MEGDFSEVPDFYPKITLKELGLFNHMGTRVHLDFDSALKGFYLSPSFHLIAVDLKCNLRECRGQTFTF